MTPWSMPDGLAAVLASWATPEHLAEILEICGPLRTDDDPEALVWVNRRSPE